MEELIYLMKLDEGMLATLVSELKSPVKKRWTRYRLLRFLVGFFSNLLIMHNVCSCRKFTPFRRVRLEWKYGTRICGDEKDERARIDRVCQKSGVILVEVEYLARLSSFAGPPSSTITIVLTNPEVISFFLFRPLQPSRHSF